MLLIFNFIGRYVIPLFVKRIDFALAWWQRIQIVLWVVYLILFYADLLRLYTAITLIFTVIVLGLGWEYWRNIFAGIMIKFNNRFKAGDFISTNQIQGTLKTINLSRSELVNEKGELVIIPNNEIRNTVLTHLHRTQDVNICIFNVTTSQDQTSQGVSKMAYDCPYISANQEIAVEKQKPNEFIVRATIIDNSFIEYANKYFDDVS